MEKSGVSGARVTVVELKKSSKMGNVQSRIQIKIIWFHPSCSLFANIAWVFCCSSENNEHCRDFSELVGISSRIYFCLYTKKLM